VTTADLLDGKINSVQIRKNEAGYHEVLVDGQKVERCTVVKVDHADPSGRLMHVTISFHCGSVEVDLPAGSWRKRIQERGEDTP